MSTRASKSFAVWTTILALVVALVALTAVGCGSDSYSDADATQTATDDSTTTDDTATHADEAAAAAAAEEARAAAAAATVPLTQADKGKPFTVKVGDTISVVLDGNPTTGYSWESAISDEAAPLLTLAGGAPIYAQDEVAPDVVGAGGKYIFVFTAQAAGRVALDLKYWRSFEAQAEPLETFTADITIQ